MENSGKIPQRAACPYAGFPAEKRDLVPVSPFLSRD
jgi:hypothetical protein